MEKISRDILCPLCDGKQWGIGRCKFCKGQAVYIGVPADLRGEKLDEWIHEQRAMWKQKIEADMFWCEVDGVKK